MFINMTVVAYIIGLVAVIGGGFLAGILYGRRGIKTAISIAHMDPLTNLPDRFVAEQALDKASALGTHVTVCVCDVNDLHHVNDEWGHVAGDQLLIAVARRLGDLLPTSPTGGFVARAGRASDEFWVICGATPIDVANAYRSNMNGFAHKAAVGVACSPENGSPRQAVACADIAMYSAKSRGEPAVIYDSLLMGVPGGIGDNLPSKIRHRRRHDDT